MLTDNRPTCLLIIYLSLVTWNTKRKKSKSIPLIQMTRHALRHKIRNICIIYKYLICSICTIYTLLGLFIAGPVLYRRNLLYKKENRQALAYVISVPLCVWCGILKNWCADTSRDQTKSKKWGALYLTANLRDMKITCIGKVIHTFPQELNPYA